MAKNISAHRLAMVIGALAWLSLGYFAAAWGDEAAVPPTREQIEADWLRQDAVRSTPAAVTPEEDAAGACDGVKDGKWGFHTALGERSLVADRSG